MAVLSAVLEALPDEATADTCAAALGRLGVDARARAFQSLMDGLPRERVLQAAELLMRLDPLLAGRHPKHRAERLIRLHVARAIAVEPRLA